MRRCGPVAKIRHGVRNGCAKRGDKRPSSPLIRGICQRSNGQTVKQLMLEVADDRAQLDALLEIVVRYALEELEEIHDH